MLTIFSFSFFILAGVCELSMSGDCFLPGSEVTITCRFVFLPFHFPSHIPHLLSQGIGTLSALMVMMILSMKLYKDQPLRMIGLLVPYLTQHLCPFWVFFDSFLYIYIYIFFKNIYFFILYIYIYLYIIYIYFYFYFYLFIYFYFYLFLFIFFFFLTLRQTFFSI